MIIFYMQAGYTFDTHEFVKAFINCKTEEEKAEAEAAKSKKIRYLILNI